MATRPNPVFAQFGLMRSTPLDNESLSARWQTSSKDRKALYIDSGLVLAVAGVEVWAPP